MKYTLLILVLTILFVSPGTASPFTQVPPAIEREVSDLLNFPPTRTFIESLEKEGAITLKWLPLGSDHFNAFWMGSERLVAINSSRKWHEGEKLYSILFELHNASAEKEFLHLDALAYKKSITQSQYVEAIERIEYQNGTKTGELLKKGVISGYFSKNSRFPQYPDFEEHFKLQMKCGHSDHIAQRYNELVSGKFPPPN